MLPRLYLLFAGIMLTGSIADRILKLTNFLDTFGSVYRRKEGFRRLCELILDGRDIAILCTRDALAHSDLEQVIAWYYYSHGGYD